MSTARFSGHSICSIEARNDPIRPATDALWSSGPTVLLSRNGAVDHSEIRLGTRV